MRNFRTLGPIFGTLSMLCAIVTVSAYAAETLLAEWLVNGGVVSSSLPSQTTGELLLVDTKANFGIACSMQLVGSVGPDGVDEITTVLSLAGATVTLAAPLLCKTSVFCEESATDIEFAPENLPWHTLLILTAPEPEAYEDRLYSASYFASCLILGIKVSEECTTLNEASGGSGTIVLNVTGGVETEPAINLTPLSTCTTGGSEAGEILFAENLTTSTEGTLAISE